MAITNSLKKVILLFCIHIIVLSLASGQTLTSTNLPLIIINTNGQVIADESKITADLKIINNTEGLNHPENTPNVYNGKIGIETRGRFSASLPQKPYGFETRDDAGNNLNVSLLGMPEEHDWILLANFNDKSLVRNTLAFELFREMGHYASRTKLCEVILNDSYQGIYILAEKIKRDKNRVDISALDTDDNAGDSLTGGYIFNIDYYNSYDSWKGSYPPPGHYDKEVFFVYNYPKYEEITQSQKTYLQGFVNTFERILYSSNFKDPLYGYRPYTNLNSFADYFLISEISRNVDGYKKSCFYHKDRNKNSVKLSAGPVWDFDWAWKDIDDCAIFKNTDGSGWAYKILDCNAWPIATGWMPKMMEDPIFVNLVKTRYSQFRQNIIKTDILNHYLDSVADYVSEAQARHFARWDILGHNYGSEIEAPAQSYAQEIEMLKSWILRRLTWLDRQLLIDVPTGLEEPLSNHNFRIWPNPAHDFVTITSDKVINQIEIVSITGKQVMQFNGISDNNNPIDISGLAPGIYIVKTTLENGNVLTNKLSVQ